MRARYSTRHVAIRVEIHARAQFFYPIFEGNFGGLLVLKMGHAAYLRKVPDVDFPKKISFHGSEFGGKSYGFRKLGHLSCFFSCFSGEDSGQSGDATGKPRVPRRSWSRHLSNTPGLARQLAASREDSARKRDNVGGKIPKFSAKPYFVGLFSRTW